MKWTLNQSELDECKQANAVLRSKLLDAETEVKSVRQDLRRMKAMNRTNEVTIGVLRRKIEDLQVGRGEELPSTRSGRNVRPPEKFQC